jgi:hypothetical protein
MPPPFYLGVLDSIVIPIVALNGAAMGAIAAIAFGTGGRNYNNPSGSPAATSQAIDAIIAGDEAAAEAAEAEKAAKVKAIDVDDDRTPEEKKRAVDGSDGGTAVPFPRFYVAVDRKDGSCSAFADSKDPNRRRGALHVGKAVGALRDESGEKLRQAALDLAYAAADAVRRNCTGAYVPLHPAPGPWLALSDLSVDTLFGVTLHVYCRLVGIAEAVEGASKGPLLSVTVDASSPACFDPSKADEVGRDALTRLAATCAARLLATVAGDEHDGAVYDLLSKGQSKIERTRRSDHEAIYRFEAAHEVRRIAGLIGTPAGGGEEVIVARAAVKTLASLHSIRNIAAIVEAPESVSAPASAGEARAGRRRALFVNVRGGDLKDFASFNQAVKARIDDAAKEIGDAAVNRLVDRARQPDLVIPIIFGDPWGMRLSASTGYGGDASDDVWIKFAAGPPWTPAVAPRWTTEPAEAPYDPDEPIPVRDDIPPIPDPPTDDPPEDDPTAGLPVLNTDELDGLRQSVMWHLVLMTCQDMETGISDLSLKRNIRVIRLMLDDAIVAGDEKFKYLLAHDGVRLIVATHALISRLRAHLASPGSVDLGAYEGVRGDPDHVNAWRLLFSQLVGVWLKVKSCGENLESVLQMLKGNEKYGGYEVDGNKLRVERFFDYITELDDEAKELLRSTLVEAMVHAMAPKDGMSDEAKARMQKWTAFFQKGDTDLAFIADCFLRMESEDYGWGKVNPPS